MLRTLVSILVLGVVVAGGYYVIREIRAVPACESALVYSIGSIDSRFDLTEAELRNALSEAAAPWNAAAGKELFVYGEGGELPVSLVYDERQATVHLGDSIDSDEARHAAAKRKVESLISEHERAVASLEAKVSGFERTQEAYERDVAYWNARGGAPADEYQKLEDRRRSLERTQAEILRQTGEVNGMVEQINQAVSEANALAMRLNSKVDTYNAFAGEDFDQGQYVRDENGARITIYEYESYDYLVRALSHEFGHALGVEHTQDPQSLMYPYNSGKPLILSAEDIEALRVVCGFD